MNLKELKILYDYSLAHDRSLIANHLTDNPTKEFLTFTSKVMRGHRSKNFSITDKKRLHQRIALLIELTGVKKNNYEHDDSGFRKIAKLLGMEPSYVQKIYYKERKNITGIVEAINLFKQDHNQVQQEAWPVMYRFVQEAELAIKLIGQKNY